MVLDGASHWQLRASLINARQMVAYQQDRNTQLQTTTAFKCNVEENKLVQQHSEARLERNKIHESHHKTIQEMKMLNKLVNRSKLDLLEAENFRSEIRTNHTTWMSHAKAIQIRTKASLKKQLESLNSLR